MPPAPDKPRNRNISACSDGPGGDSSRRRRVRCRGRLLHIAAVIPPFMRFSCEVSGFSGFNRFNGCDRFNNFHALPATSNDFLWNLS